MDKEQRSAEANYILNHPLVKEALQAIRDDIVRKLESCPLRDRDGQHELTLLLQVSNRFTQELKVHIETGELMGQKTIIDSANAYIKGLLLRQ